MQRDTEVCPRSIRIITEVRTKVGQKADDFRVVGVADQVSKVISKAVSENELFLLMAKQNGNKTCNRNKHRCRNSTIYAAPKWHKRYHKTCHKKPVFLGRGYLIP